MTNLPTMDNEQLLKVMTSPTLGMAARLSESVPIDITDKKELNAALTTLLLELALANDKGRIHFDSEEECGFFHGLMAINLAQVFEGKVKAELASCH